MLASWLLLALPPVPLPTEGPGRQDLHRKALVIRAERVLVRKGKVLEKATILIENGVIVAVGAGISVPEGVREIRGKLVCAGFIDPWSSIGLEPGSAQDLGTGADTETVDGVDSWSALHVREEALRGGVTSARVQAGLSAPIGGVGAVLRCDPTLGSGGSSAPGSVVLGDACLAATIGVTRKGKRGDIFDRVAEVDKLVGKLESGDRYRRAQVAYRADLEEWKKAIAEKEKELEKDFKKAKKNREKKKKEAEEKGKEFKEERYKEDKKPRRPKFNAESEVLARAAEGEIPLVVEVHRAEEIRRLLEKTEELDRLRLVLAGATEALPYADELARRHIPVIVWPAAGKPSGGEFARHDLALAAGLSEAGVKVLIGTGGEESARELRLLAALAVGHGLDRDEALAAITEYPAQVFDLDRLGTVERGKDADLLVLDGDPLDTTTRISFVLSHGRVVIEP